MIEVGEFEFSYKDHAMRSYILKATPLSSDHVMITYEYISELKKVKSELTQKNKDLKEKNSSLEEFAYIASHDLQQPLNTINGFVGIFKSKYLDLLDETGLKCLNYIEEASNRLRNMILGILEHSRLGTNIVVTTVDLNETLDDIVKDLQGIITKKEGEVRIGNLPKVEGCAIGLRLLFQNLIENGLKYQKDNNKPIIDISFEEKEGSYLFHIKDNGIGIQEEHKDKIFQVFQRLHTDETIYKGSGLGLANCQKIVQLCGGKLWVESVYGEGSTFSFTLPKK
ncbi:GHKL domain-containing protein [Flammeovirga yaeyamensis]|uniref:histidine kinase n=2 Tax=Flammeovirga yaeyamensis TaxID=367791 RepID=A0AAX1N793_9BACT|nr:ATP-binding protein [Flammeovirga yaeyamensis]MBB3699767.1 light-regulated signal transduction histidine kinase (bacteriophytochrome) [Flammeovirga yaeyamensis]NMF36664.1 GHKL domain-containing protein [Flammeovirga yaeyamensis]QWG02291.1 GHKL domain-containing protein [Flammeovirga yaeyamensis]